VYAKAREGSNMRKLAWVMSAVILTTGLISGIRVAGLSVDYLAGRYPGVVWSGADKIDWNFLRRGWLSRQAIYVSDARRATIEAWYTERYELDPQAGRQILDCAVFRTTHLLVGIVYAVSVSLCEVPGGTRIVVNESVFYPPPSARPATP
jgi:hypothetical protein